jgi:hypothetical protein
MNYALEAATSGCLLTQLHDGISARRVFRVQVWRATFDLKHRNTRIMISISTV